MRCLTDWKADQLIFINESTANERIMDRKYEWAPVGLPSKEIHPAKHSECWSLLSAYIFDGYITYDIVHGSYMAELFNDFIENKVLPLCNAYPCERSILIVDNVRIYKSQIYKAQIYEYLYVLTI